MQRQEMEKRQQIEAEKRQQMEAEKRQQMEAEKRQFELNQQLESSKRRYSFDLSQQQLEIEKRQYELSQQIEAGKRHFDQSHQQSNGNDVTRSVGQHFTLNASNESSVDLTVEKTPSDQQKQQFQYVNSIHNFILFIFGVKF